MATIYSAVQLANFRKLNLSEANKDLAISAGQAGRGSFIAAQRILPAVIKALKIPDSEMGLAKKVTTQYLQIDRAYNTVNFLTRSEYQRGIDGDLNFSNKDHVKPEHFKALKARFKVVQDCYKPTASEVQHKSDAARIADLEKQLAALKK
jgi:hypothetical protein